MPTQNHGYNDPAAGTTDWHTPLNENFAELDTDVEIRDVEANLGNYTPASNAKFVATDTGTVYVGDGTSWTEWGAIPASSFVQTADLGGSAGAIAPSFNYANPLLVGVTPGGDAVGLTGIDGVALPGQEVIIRLDGSGTLELVHQAGTANPLVNLSGTTDLLDAGVAKYAYDGAVWRMLSSNIA